jgi:hypothetical protein
VLAVAATVDIVADGREAPPHPVIASADRAKTLRASGAGGTERISQF